MLEFIAKFITLDNQKHAHLIQKLKDVKDLKKALEILTEKDLYISGKLVAKMEAEFEEFKIK